MTVAEVLEPNELKKEGVLAWFALTKAKSSFFVQEFLTRGECVRSHSSSVLHLVYPAEGLCRAEPEGGPIVFTFYFIGVGKGTGGFKF